MSVSSCFSPHLFLCGSLLSYCLSSLFPCLCFLGLCLSVSLLVPVCIPPPPELPRTSSLSQAPSCQAAHVVGCLETCRAHSRGWIFLRPKNLLTFEFATQRTEVQPQGKTAPATKASFLSFLFLKDTLPWGCGLALEVLPLLPAPTPTISTGQSRAGDSFVFWSLSTWATDVPSSNPQQLLSHLPQIPLLSQFSPEFKRVTRVGERGSRSRLCDKPGEVLRTQQGSQTSPGSRLAAYLRAG